MTDELVDEIMEKHYKEKDRDNKNQTIGAVAAFLTASVFLIPVGISIKQSKQEQVNIIQSPILKDVNNDGKQDLIFKLNSGDDFILYKTDKGYEFQKNYLGADEK